MARVFITGSTDGVGFLAAQSLLSGGHEVVLHARNAERASDVKQKLPKAAHVVTGDLSEIGQIRSVAEQVNRLGRFDAVIHNAGVYVTSEQLPAATKDGLPVNFEVNTLAPYMLTALIDRPDRLVYLSSGMHLGVEGDLSDFEWKRRPWDPVAAYSETKLYVIMLTLAVARYWPDVLSNAVNPGWIPTKMGGPSAPDDLNEGYRTQAWLAVSADAEARVTGKYFFHREQQPPDPKALDEDFQNRLVALCRQLSGVSLEGV